MGKRSTGKFERLPRDYYRTPPAAVEALLPHLPPECTYIEPCAGDGALVEALEGHAACVGAYDIEPQADWIQKGDVFDLFDCKADMFITNPPWARPFLHKAITHLSDIKTTWLLFDSDWAYTKQAHPYLYNCTKIVAIGRVKWFGNVAGKDNCSWYQFSSLAQTEFYGRQAA
tara:strand:- start:155 stop:670 length:516 start_codon:yes stop_codon:yes gene_type:complete